MHITVEPSRNGARLGGGRDAVSEHSPGLSLRARAASAGTGCLLLALALLLYDQAGVPVDRPGVRAETASPVVASLSTAAPAPADEPYPTADDSEVPAAAEPKPHDDVKDAARSFAVQYFTMAERDEATVIPWLTRHYANSVRFYGQVRSRQAIVREKAAYLRRWPDRSYRLRPATLRVECDAPKRLCRSSGVLDWTTGSPRRGSTASGAAAFSLTTLSLDGVQRIVGETSRIVRRD